MELTIRDAKPDDAAGIVAVFNPIILAGSFTLFDTPFSVETYQKHGFRIVGKAERHANLHGRYVDVIIVERLL